MNQYEGMFLFDPTFGADFDACEGEIRRLMDRAEAELVFCKKWDERRLAYRVQGRKRGVYVLTYFKCAPDKITPLNRDVQISEPVLRALFLRADDVTPELMEQAIQSRGEAAEAEEEDRRDGPDGRRGRGDRRGEGRGERRGEHRDEGRGERRPPDRGRRDEPAQETTGGPDTAPSATATAEDNRPEAQPGPGEPPAESPAPDQTNEPEKPAEG